MGYIFVESIFPTRKQKVFITDILFVRYVFLEIFRCLKIKKLTLYNVTLSNILGDNFEKALKIINEILKN